MLNRRRFLQTVSTGLLAAPLVADAQPQGGRIWRIGILHATESQTVADHVAALQRGLAELGYVSGRQVQFVTRNAGTHVGRLPELASELVRSRVDVLVTSTNPTTLAAKNATTVIPIVMTTGVDPVDAGLVTSLAQPGANVTGLTFDVDARQLAAKRLEILKEVIPSLSRVAILWNPEYRPGLSRVKGTEEAAHMLGVATISVKLVRDDDLERAFTEIRSARADAATVLSDPLVVTRRAEITAMAARYRMPAIYALREFVQAGGLISYATNLLDQWHRAARYIDRILRGAKPRELPVEQPTAFELVINLKTARTLGLTMPRSLLIRADQVIDP